MAALKAAEDWRNPKAGARSRRVLERAGPVALLVSIVCAELQLSRRLKQGNKVLAKKIGSRSLFHKRATPE